MGWFKKKSDPISERARLLNNQIAALESEIKKLSTRPGGAEPAVAPPPRDRSPFIQPATPSATQPAAPPLQPRLRSTALPQAANAPAPAAVHEPIFEEVGQSRIQSDTEPTSPAHYNDLGVRKYDLTSAWQRLKNHFRGPVTSNPKLVHYLSAGSIQGLRPLRYEKRVARNRFLFFAAFLVLILWGLIAFVIGRR